MKAYLLMLNVYFGFLVLLFECQVSLNITTLKDQIKNQISNSSILSDITLNPQKYVKDGIGDMILKNEGLINDSKFKKILTSLLTMGQGKYNLTDIGKAYEKLGESLLQMNEDDKEKYKNLLNFLRNYLLKVGYICGPYAKSLNKSDFTDEDQKKIIKESELLKSYILNIESNNDKLKKMYSDIYSIALNKDSYKFSSYVDSIENGLMSLKKTKNVTLTQYEKNSIKNIEQFIKRMKYSCKDEKNIFSNTSFYNEAESKDFNNANYYYNSHESKNNNSYFKEEYENYNENRPRKKCNPSECLGCCVKNVCKDESECYFRSIGSILILAGITILCCCGCMCFWFTVAFLIRRMRRRFDNRRQHDERNTEMPVTGIPVSGNIGNPQPNPNINQSINNDLSYIHVNSSDSNDNSKIAKI